MAGYGMGGYVGSSEDQRRILRQEKEREAQRRQFEDEKKKLENANAGLRQFGAGTSEVGIIQERTLLLRLFFHYYDGKEEQD